MAEFEKFTDFADGSHMNLKKVLVSLGRRIDLWFYRKETASFLIFTFLTVGILSFQNCGKRIDGLNQTALNSMGPVPPKTEEQSRPSPSPSKAPVSLAPPTGFTILIKTCTQDREKHCAEIWNDSKGTRQIELLSNALRYGVVEFGRMGLHAGGTEGFAYLYASAGSLGHPVIFVLDLDNTRLVATTRFNEPYTLQNTFFSLISDNTGKRYPFLAPGARYLAETHNEYVCLFDPTKTSINDSYCGMGFRNLPASFNTSNGMTDLAASGFRHNRGWIEDLDGDGWEDIHLPYLKFILSISGRTGQRLALTTFDVASTTEPNSPPYFHSGRFFAGFSAIRNPVTQEKGVTFVGGSPVGSFYDFNCGVSRYVGTFKWGTQNSTGGLSGTFDGSLVWSQYLSFGPTIFKAPFDSVTNYIRKGNDLDRCAHRFGDGTVRIQEKSFLVYNQFASQSNSLVCQPELLAQQESQYASAMVQAYEACMRTEAAKISGTWSVKVLDPWSGALLASLDRAYAWGTVPNFRNGEAVSLVIERLPSAVSSIRFDQLGYTPTQYLIAPINPDGTIGAGSLTQSVSGRPTLIDSPGYFGSLPSGSGTTSGGLPGLRYKDIDSDGYNEVQFSGGAWLGFSGPLNGIQTKGIQP